MALWKIEVTIWGFFALILTLKNEKLLESSVSKVNFIFLCFEFMWLTKSFKCSLDLNRTKKIVNVASVNYRFKLRRTFIKPKFLIMTKMASASMGPKGEPITTPSICLQNLLSKMKDDSVVVSLSKLFFHLIYLYKNYWRVNRWHSS